MGHSLYENHWGSPTLTLLNVHSVLGVLNVLNVLYVLNMHTVLYTPIDASLACWALFFFIFSSFSLLRAFSQLMKETEKEIPFLFFHFLHFVRS